MLKKSRTSLHTSHLSPNFLLYSRITYISTLYSIETITVGDKRIGIKTSVLEEKATACNMLCCYADELKEGFYPWIDQVSGCIDFCSMYLIW